MTPENIICENSKKEKQSKDRLVISSRKIIRPELGRKGFELNMEEELFCSFCGKTARVVKKIVVGPGEHICSECVKKAYGEMSGQDQNVREKTDDCLDDRRQCENAEILHFKDYESTDNSGDLILIVDSTGVIIEIKKGFGVDSNDLIGMTPEDVVSEPKKISEGHKLMAATLATGNPETITALVNYNNTKMIRQFRIEKHSEKSLMVSSRKIS